MAGCVGSCELVTAKRLGFYSTVLYEPNTVEHCHSLFTQYLTAHHLFYFFTTLKDAISAWSGIGFFATAAALLVDLINSLNPFYYYHAYKLDYSHFLTWTRVEI